MTSDIICTTHKTITLKVNMKPKHLVGSLFKEIF